MSKRKHDKKTRDKWKEQKRLWRERNPYKATYATAKMNAKRRGKDFSFTFDDWMVFNIETNYINEKGRNAEDASMDRKINEEGYSLSNTQKLPVGVNSSKGTDSWPIKPPF